MLVKCVIKDTLSILTPEDEKPEKKIKEDWLQPLQEDQVTSTS